MLVVEVGIAMPGVGLRINNSSFLNIVLVKIDLYMDSFVRMLPSVSN